MAMAMEWQMGEQPDWLSVEEKGEVPENLLNDLLKAPIWTSLERRGESFCTNVASFVLFCCFRSFFVVFECCQQQ